MCIVCTAIPKSTCWAEVMSNSDKIKPVTLAVIELRLSKGIRQAVSWSEENSIELIFFLNCSNLLKAFKVILKALLGLVTPIRHQDGMAFG